MAVFNLSTILVAILATSPFWIEYLTRQEYPLVNPNGGVLITGSSTGIGKHAALTLAEKGFFTLAAVR